MTDFDDKLLPAGEISDNSDNDTDIRVASPDGAATNRNTRTDANISMNENESSIRSDPPPSATEPPSRESSMSSSTVANESVVDPNHVAQSVDLLGPLIDINQSATDTSILSVDPDGVYPSHRHKESMIFMDNGMDDDAVDYYSPRESAGAGRRSPSPLSGDEAEEPRSQQAVRPAAKKNQIVSTSRNDQKIQEDEGEEKKSTDRPASIQTNSKDSKNAKDPFAGVHDQFFQESPILSQAQESDAYMQPSEHSLTSPLEHRDSGLPHMIYHHQQQQGNHHIPRMPNLVVPNVQRTKAIPQLKDYPHHQLQGMQIMGSGQVMVGGKRKIHLRLLEDVPPEGGKRVSFLGFSRKKKSSLLLSPRDPTYDENKEEVVDRGRVTVSWYEGTSSLELHEHVRNSVVRKLGLSRTEKLTDLRILDEAFDPPEEIVLSPYIPNGSRLLLRFSTSDKGGAHTPVRPSYSDGPPLSPSAAPSPFRSAVDLNGLGLNPNQLALLGTRLKGLETTKTPKSERKKILRDKKAKSSAFERKQSKELQDGNETDDALSQASTTLEMNSLHPEDQIEKSLRQITELLIADRANRAVPPRQEKRQVVFVLANYFVLFLSLIAISAEIQARVPNWHASIEQHLKNVQNCSKDEDSLYECVSKGDFAGLIASVVLWISRSAATRRIFLFGFESTQKLWSVVYESMVTAVCWGFSYMFIRRGMNPDTSERFLQKYWKDAVYGSLSGFNAAFMKHVLKNLIPQEAIEDVLMQDRKLKILSWFKDFN